MDRSARRMQHWRRTMRSPRLPVAAGALVCLVGGALCLALAQGVEDPGQSTGWAAGAIAHAQRMRAYQDAGKGPQRTPAVMPTFQVDDGLRGQVATYQPDGATPTAGNAFFQPLGTNDRTCFTCHQPQTGWTISARDAQARFDQSGGSDPLFRLVDGATCPSADVSTLAAKRQAYKLLWEKGLIRIGLAVPANAQFAFVAVDDPYHCTTNPSTGLTSQTTGTVSVYRRPLPTTNLTFLSTIMWDGREPSLQHQAVTATLIHAQATAAPTPDQQTQIVDFQLGLFTTQAFDKDARNLDAGGATGGPRALADQVFFIGINDPLGFNPTGAPFDPAIFDLYAAWASLPGQGGVTPHRQAVARGEQVFNTKPIAITGVAGLHDGLGFCGTCHDAPNVGHHSVKLPLNIGLTDAMPPPPALDITGLPVFTMRCTAGPLAGQTFTVTDPGRALISGQCVDIGKVKGPILRGMAARAPYFHNGSAATLRDVVNFYDARFQIGFTEQEKQDLVAFLNTL
jgi:cytochrome c peroxidase